MPPNLGLGRRPGQGDASALQRLAQGLEDLALEFRKLVEEQDAAMAREISPGLGIDPPPTSATAEAEWCGWR